MVDPHPKLKWQNLIHKKCPACNARLETTSTGFECPYKKNGECPGSFFISRRKFVEILTNPEHFAVRFLNKHEHEILNNALHEIGITDTDAFWRAPVQHDIIGAEKPLEN